MKTMYAFLVTVVVLYGVASAQHTNAGTTPFPFLAIGVDARSQGMGDAAVGMPADLYGAVSNPSTLAYQKEMQAMLAYKPVMLDVRAGAFGFSRPTQTKGTISGHLQYLSYGRIDGVDEYDKPTGIAWNPYSVVGGISWAKMIMDDWALGFTVKGIYHNLDHGYSADGAALDVGMQYRLMSSRLIVGAIIRNLGFVRQWYSEDVPESRLLPIAASTGVSYIPRSFSSLRLALDLEKAVDDYLNYKAGLEMALYKQFLLARVGYRFSNRDFRELFRIIRNDSDDSYQKTNWTSVTFGVGINAPIAATDVRFDAALVLHTEGLPPTPVFSAIIGF